MNPMEDSGLRAVVYAAKSFDIAADPRQIWHAHGKTDGLYGYTDIIRCAQKLGLKGKVATLSMDRLLTTPMPFVMTRKDDDSKFLIVGVEGAKIRVANPVTGRNVLKTVEDIARDFLPKVIFFKKQPVWKLKNTAFGFSWFIPSVIKHSARFKKILIASICIQAFALVTPKLFQVVIDNVLVSRGLQSLDVLAIGLLGLAFFEPFMIYLRSLIFAHLGSCVNSELSARLFRHLVHLPLNYFRTRQAGDIIARVRELDHIRNFLTGSALMTVVDLVFIGVFLAFMFSYASKLAYIVLATLAIFCITWLCIGPFLRRRVETAYERNADITAFLTESVTGIETIKSMGIGDRFSRKWEDRLGASLKASFRADMLGYWAGGGIGLIQKLSAAIVLWFGVDLVLKGELTVGELIAFNMLSSHVTMPIIRLSLVWQDFRHTGISIKRIGDILKEKTETVASAGRSSLDNISGRIELRKVSFKYGDEKPEVLRRLDLEIAAGEVIGVAGKSGSGKSTITKLIQGLYTPNSGQILVDGVDLAMADPAMLRRRMGVVLQENFLFNGSVEDNIALGNPSASKGDIRYAAILSGADEFIRELAEQYETQIGERGGKLSGGQRQRIAIARALVANPSILIFDEATSALDYETEAAIFKRLPEIFKNRTVIMIAHRLNCMPLCDRIVVMDKGEVVEQGEHDVLVSQGKRYQELWELQNTR